MRCLAVPCLPCRAMLSRAMPRRACRTFPRHSPPCRALRCLPRPSCVPSQTLPRHALPAIHHRSPAVLSKPIPAQPCPAVPCRALPALPSQTLPRHAVPCPALRCPACIALPRPTMLSRAMPRLQRLFSVADDLKRAPAHAAGVFRERTAFPNTDLCPNTHQQSRNILDGKLI